MSQSGFAEKPQRAKKNGRTNGARIFSGTAGRAELRLAGEWARRRRLQAMSQSGFAEKPQRVRKRANEWCEVFSGAARRAELRLAGE